MPDPVNLTRCSQCQAEIVDLTPNTASSPLCQTCDAQQAPELVIATDAHLVQKAADSVPEDVADGLASRVVHPETTNGQGTAIEAAYEVVPSDENGYTVVNPDDADVEHTAKGDSSRPGSKEYSRWNNSEHDDRDEEHREPRRRRHSRRRSEKRSTDDGYTFALVSLIIGMLSLVLFCLGPLTTVFCILGVILGVQSLPTPYRKLSVVGITLSLVGLIFSLGFSALFMTGVIMGISDKMGPPGSNPIFSPRKR